MEDRDLTTMVYARSAYILAWAALLAVVLLGASVFQCVSMPPGPPKPTLLDQCVKGCGPRFKNFTTECERCVADEHGGWHDSPAKCECDPEQRL